MMRKSSILENEISFIIISTFLEYTHKLRSVLFLFQKNFILGIDSSTATLSVLGERRTEHKKIKKARIGGKVGV